MKGMSRSHPLVLAIFLCFYAVILTGCWDRTEVNDLALITGAAIDYHSKKKIALSVQIFIARASGGGGGVGMEKKSGSGTQNTFVRTATGENIAAALANLQEQIPRKLFWGHAEIVIFGEAAAKNGIRDDIDYLMRAPQPRERAYIYVSKGKASEALELQSILERDTSEVLREISKSKIMISVTLAELAAMLTSDSGDAALPYLNPVISKSEKDKAMSLIRGTAVFKKDKMTGSINDSISRGALWLRNEMKTAVITVNPKNSSGELSFRLLNSSTKLKPSIVNGELKMAVDIHTEVDALQNETSLNLISDEKALKKVEAYINFDIESRVKLALKRVQKGMKSDIFDFASVFHRAYPKEWEKMKDHWSELYPTVDVTVTAKSKVLRPGLSNVEPTSPK
ncbi:Ger(x)C family spore germination protein [Paenibacillus solisilvae]|uniref:Ger(X)C family spore germination protein n=1 Tax=Paenibacillus solisilvae TaxID=2486751 RepID=A0ABW0VTK7_9BACL